MTKSKTLIAIGGGILVVAMAGIVAVDRILTRLFPVANHIISTSRSPTGDLEAYAFHSSVSGFVSTGSTVVALRKANTPIAFDDASSEVYVIEGLRQVRVKWNSSHSLNVIVERWRADAAAGPAPRRSLERWNDVHIKVTPSNASP